tara:strand:- start:815 stop:1114 length:300 start_codon:yes stop_codon:yes gene_type:complete
MTPMQKLTLEILNDCMSIVEKRVSNPIYKKVIKTMGYPYARDQILKTNDVELKRDMNLIYNRLKKHFDKKQLKDEIDFSNSISDIQVPEFITKQVGDYF